MCGSPADQGFVWMRNWSEISPCMSVDCSTIEIGGPSVYPPAPAFLFEPPASYGPKVWANSTGASQYRRSLYVHQFRSVPYPPLQVFDAPKGDAACIRRERSNTPLQALVMLNEDQFFQCARAMAARVVRESAPGDSQRIHYAFRLCTDASQVKPNTTPSPSCLNNSDSGSSWERSMSVCCLRANPIW